MHHFPPLLTDAPIGRHVCQFHKCAQSLTQAVTTFIDVGLYRREGVVVIATAARRAAVLRRLAASKIDTAAAIASGQLVMLDADEVLDALIAGGMPRPRAFRDVIAPVLGSVVARGYGRVRLYGETVNQLWQDGLTDAAVRLEHLWNDLIGDYPVSLFCGYEIDGLDPRTYARPLDAIARQHTDLIISDDDHRLQAAVDAATTEILGLPLSSALTYHGREGVDPVEHRLPAGQRTLLWLNRNMPSAMVKVLSRARSHYAPV